MQCYSNFLILTCALYFVYGKNQDWNASLQPLFTSYFENIGIRSVTMYACSNEEAVSMAKYITRNSIVTMKFIVQNEKKVLEMDAQPYPQGILINLSCTTNFNQWATNMLNTSYRWLTYIDNESDLRSIDESNVNLLSDVVQARCSGIKCTLFDTYRVRNTDPLELIEYGQWENFTLRLGTRRKRNDMRGVVLVGGVVLLGIQTKSPDEVPSGLEDRYVFEGCDIFSRFHVTIYRRLEMLYNFKLKLVRSATFGSLQPNGSFDGLVGDVLTQKADVGITGVQPCPERADRVSMLMQIYAVRLIFVLRQPRATDTFSALIMPLSMEVWTCVFIFMLVFSICFETIRIVGKDKTLTPFEGFRFVIGALTEQGLPADCRKTSGRVLCFFLLFLGLILLNYYNSAIMNALLLPVPVSIKSLDQLISPASPVKPGFLNVSYLVDSRSNHQYMLPNTFKAVLRTPNPIMDLDSGIKRVKDSNFAFAAEDSVLYDKISRTFTDGEKCELSYIELNKPIMINSPIAKNSPFKEMFARGLIYIYENGLADRENNYWRAQKPKCLGSISFIYVSLQAVGVSFAVLTGGFIMSFAILFVEYYVAKLKREANDTAIKFCWA